MKHLTILKYFIILTTIVFLLYSCKWGSKRELPKGKNFICVVDFSDSKNALERLQFYMNVIKDNIIPKLGIYDKISVIPIDNASLTNSSDIILEDLSTNNFEPEMASPMEEEQLTKENLRKYKESLSLRFVQNFQNVINQRNKSNQGTDIFGALEVVKGKLKVADDNYLIILSDMMNYNSTLNMEPDNKGFDRSALDDILAKISNNEMPNTIALVLTGEQVEATPEHFKLVKTFWTKYFEKNRIKLYDYNSASVSKLNEMMALPITD